MPPTPPSGYFGPLGSSGDTNSLVGVFCAGLAMMGGRAARKGRRWGGPVMMLGFALALYSHAAFFVYGVIYLAIEAVYFRDRAAAVRLVAAALLAGVAAVPVHWESLRYPEYVSFNNTVYDPHAPMRLGLFVRTIYYNLEILALPHRWFNDYRSLACRRWRDSRSTSTESARWRSSTTTRSPNARESRRS